MNNVTQALYALLLATMAAASHAEPTPRIPVTNVKMLLKHAIEHGSAQGTLVGEAATFVRNRFGTTTPIEIDVKTLQILRDPSCRRLEVTTYQAGVTEKGIAADKRLTYQLNYCRDGRLPDRS